MSVLMMQMASRSILFYSILFCSKILQMMMFGSLGGKESLNCFVFTAEVKHSMLQHQHGVQMNQENKVSSSVFPFFREDL